MTRLLRSVRTDRVVGAVSDTDGPTFEGAAGNVLAAMRRDLGDAATVREVIANGWSNGWLYFSALEV